MTRMLFGPVLITALFVGTLCGCQSTGGGTYGGSNSHASHNIDSTTFMHRSVAWFTSPVWWLE